jgi:mannose-1-phosphate guanylyltransferase
MIELVREHLPTIPVSQILGEPMGRSTAAAIGWAAATIARSDPQAIMMVLTADHVIAKIDIFNQALRLAVRLAGQGYLVTLGIKPTGPETGYGYIRFGAALSEGFDHQAFYGERFVEKPNVATAQTYLQDGHYVWNSGMFVWKVETILSEIEKHLPELAQKIDTIAESMGTAQERAILDEVWPTLQTISIDYGVMEKASRFAVIPVEIGWNDVGNWEQYGSLFPADQDEVRCVGHHVGLGSSNIFVYNNTQREVFTIGLENVVIVEMEDKTVICHKDEVQRVKELAESQLKKAR